MVIIITTIRRRNSNNTNNEDDDNDNGDDGNEDYKNDDDNNEDNCGGDDYDINDDSNNKLTILTKTNTINEPMLLTGVLRTFTCQCAPQTDQTRASPLPSKIILSIFVKDTKVQIRS